MTIDEQVRRLSAGEEPELTDATMRLLYRFSSERPMRPSQLVSRRCDRRHAVCQILRLVRHGFVERVPGGFSSRQRSLLSEQLNEAES